MAYDRMSGQHGAERSAVVLRGLIEQRAWAALATVFTEVIQNGLGGDHDEQIGERGALRSLQQHAQRFDVGRRRHHHRELWRRRALGGGAVDATSACDGHRGRRVAQCVGGGARGALEDRMQRDLEVVLRRLRRAAPVLQRGAGVLGVGAGDEAVVDHVQKILRAEACERVARGRRRRRPGAPQLRARARSPHIPGQHAHSHRVARTARISRR